MHPSSLTQYKTTHDLLLSVLYSELGIYSATHPASIYHGVVLAFEELKGVLLGDEVEMLYSIIISTPVSRRDDMSLFYKLYKGVNECNELLFSDEKVTQFGILPVVAEMITTYPNVAALVERACIIHANAHGDVVRKRMERTLHQLNINSYIRLNRKVAQ